MAPILPEGHRAGPETLGLHERGFRDAADLLDTAAVVRARRAAHAHPLRKIGANLRR